MDNIYLSVPLFNLCALKAAAKSLYCSSSFALIPKSEVSVPIQMPYIVGEESESPIDSPQIQVAPLAAASGQNVEDGAWLQEGTTETPSEAKKHKHRSLRTKLRLAAPDDEVYL